MNNEEGKRGARIILGIKKKGEGGCLLALIFVSFILQLISKLAHRAF